MFDADGNYCGPTYTLSYEGFLFEVDTDGWNAHGYDRWEDAVSILNAYKHYVEEGQMTMYIEHNEYGVTLSYNPITKEWEWY